MGSELIFELNTNLGEFKSEIKEFISDPLSEMDKVFQATEKTVANFTGAIADVGNQGEVLVYFESMVTKMERLDKAIKSLDRNIKLLVKTIQWLSTSFGGVIKAIIGSVVKSGARFDKFKEKGTSTFQAIMGSAKLGFREIGKAIKKLPGGIKIPIAMAGGAMAGKMMFKLTRGMKSQGQTAQQLRAFLDRLKAGYQAVKTAVMAAYNAFKKHDDAIGILEGRLKATGGAVGLTSQELQKMASALQEQTNYSDEAIMGAEGILLKFTSIGKDVFPNALKAVLDMSAALGKDLTTSSNLLGEALNNPLEGMRNLEAEGIVFSDSQRSLIESYIETGDVMSAQEIILDNLSSKFGGSAAEAATGFSGKLDQLKNSFSDLLEGLGEGLTRSIGFQNAMDNLKALFNDPSFRQGLIKVAELIARIVSDALEALTAIPQLMALSDQEAARVSNDIDRLDNRIKVMTSSFEKAGVSKEKFKEALDSFTETEKKIAEINKAIKLIEKFGGDSESNQRKVNELKREMLELRLADIDAINKENEKYGISNETKEKARQLRLAEGQAIQSATHGKKKLEKATKELTEQESLQAKEIDRLKKHVQTLSKALLDKNKSAVTSKKVTVEYTEAEKDLAKALNASPAVIRKIGDENAKYAKSLKLTGDELGDYSKKEWELAKRLKTTPEIVRKLSYQQMDYAKKLRLTGDEVTKYTNKELQLAVELNTHPAKIKTLSDEQIKYAKELKLTGDEVAKYTMAELAAAKQHEVTPKLLKQMGEEYVGLAKDLGLSEKEMNQFSLAELKATNGTQEGLEALKKYGLEHVNLANKLGMTAEGLDKTQKAVAFAQQAFAGFRQIIGELGVELSEGMTHALDAGTKGLDAYSKFLQGDFVGAAVGAVSAIISLGKAIFSLFKGDGVGEAIDRERRFISISEEMEEKIRDLEEQLGNTHAATSMLMDEIIQEAYINGNNFENYAKRVGEIVLDLDRGYINVKEFQESMGKAWNALLEEAQTLGMEGSFEMLSTIRNMRNRGMEVAEIQEYVNEQIKSGIDAYTEYLNTFSGVSEITEKIKELEEELAGTAEGTQEYLDLTAKLQEQHDLLNLGIEDISANFESMQLYAVGMIDALLAEGATYLEVIDAIGPALDQITEYALLSGEEITGALKEMTDMREFVNQNEELVTRISTTTKMMEALGNTSYLSLRLFNQFQEDAQVNFDELIDKGAEAEQAYQLVAPQLGKLLWYSQQYGYELDENTKKMIVEAEQHGVNMKAMIPPQQKMVSLLEELVRVMGGDIPYATDKFRDHFRNGIDGIRGETGKWGRELDGIEDRFRRGLPEAVAGFDREYQDHMSGHSIVTETGKWKYSLEEVNDILGRDLIDTASDLDDKYSHVMGDINHYLENTSKEGYKARLTFDEMVDELVVLKDAYDNLASQESLSEGQQNVMDDYKRQIEELSAAIEESAPTLDNYREKFKDLKSELSGNIGVNTEMIGVARGLRSQGLSTDEIDEQIESSLTSGAKGLADWIVTADDAETFTQSQEMIVGYFSALQAEGKSLTEIMAIMGDSFDAVAGKTITDEMAEDGFVLSDTFNELYGLQQKMAENDDLIKGIEGLSTALHGMGDSMLYMTDETFVNFETAAVGAFNKLEAAGFSQKQSLQMISPLLKDLEAYSAEYGYTLDESTAKLLDEAKASGIIKEEQKSDTEMLIDANEQLAEVMNNMVNIFTDMGDASPFKQMEEHAKKLQAEIQNMKKELEKLYAQKEKYNDQKTEGYVTAALGFHGILPKDTWFKLHKGERVDVWTPEETRRLQATPVQRMNLSDTRYSDNAGGDIIFEHITVQSENGEEAVREFMTAIKGNKYGVQNLIRKVAH